jgi:tetratricopeptide (TPR) repeat protein
MPNSNQSRLKQIFAEAAELEDRQRAAFLDQACGGEPTLRAEIEDLLTALRQSDGLLGASNVGDLLLPPDRPVQSLSPGERVGRFEIIRLIGKGGMGEVYEAQDHHFGDRVALKTIRSEFLTRPDFVARFRREIHLSRKVTHFNVCRLYDVGRHLIQGAETAYLTMELLHGQTLAERIHRGTVPLGEAIPILRQMLEGIAALHAAQVIHRDLKPANVILMQTEQGLRVVITDFGLAHPIVGPADDETLTAAGQVVGTPAYMPPEQLSGKKLGPEADIYSLGIVMYELLCGRRPFDAENFVDSAAQKTSGKVDPPSKYAVLNRRWDTLVLSCLHHDPARRPRSVQQLIEEFDGAVALGQGKRLELRALPQLARRMLRRPAVYVVAVLLAAVMVPLQIPKWRKPVLRQLCQAFPGAAVVCELPAARDIAVFPFQTSGRGPAQSALAAGLAAYVRESFERMFPDQRNVCIHLRNDRLADGVGLALDGAVTAEGDTLEFRFAVREARGESGSGPLLLRQVRIRVPAADARRLHTECIAELARALEIGYDNREWTAWQNAGPVHSDAFASFLRGIGYLERGEYEQAIPAFNAAVDPTKDFAFAPAQVALGDAYRLLHNKTGDVTYAIRAQQAYQRAAPLDRDFGFAQAHKRWGELEASLRHPTAALEHFVTELNLRPYDLQLLKSAVGSAEAAGQTERAEALLTGAITRAPRCWLNHNTLADFYSRHGRFPAAEKELLEVVRLAPDNANAYNNLAFDYLKVGRLDDAIEMASKATRLRPIPKAYANLGRAYLNRSCRGDALVNLKKAVDLDPGDFIVRASLAEGLYATDPRSQEALDAYSQTVKLSEQYLEKSSNYAYAHVQRALNLARLGRKDEAVNAAARALELGGNSNDIRLRAAETWEIAGLRQRALAELDAALKNGLPLYEAEAAFGLAVLRRDPLYLRMLERQHLNAASDPGGLTLSKGMPCPNSATPGVGLPESDPQREKGQRP